MELKDILTLLVAAYAALLSTYVAVVQRQDKAPRVKVRTSYGFLTAGPQISDTHILMEAANIGEKPVMLSSAGHVVMARPLRIQYENALYHVTCRGNERKSIFRDAHDKNVFLELLDDGLKTYNIILYCYVLMDNHFHLLLETPLANLSGFMRWFNITYTSHYNRRHKRTGHLYQGRYKSILVEKKSYLHILSRYTQSD